MLLDAAGGCEIDAAHQKCSLMCRWPQRLVVRFMVQVEMMEALLRAGAAIDPYLLERFEEQYGVPVQSLEVRLSCQLPGMLSVNCTELWHLSA